MIKMQMLIEIRIIIMGTRAEVISYVIDAASQDILGETAEKFSVTLVRSSDI